MALNDYLKSLDIHICSYSILAAISAVYFVISLFGFIKVDLAFSICAFLFCLLITGFGFFTVFMKDQKYKTYVSLNNNFLLPENISLLIYFFS